MLNLRFCTVISNDGITIFHRSFIEDELDQYLFSGFSSAMIAFSKELGDELTAIRMEKQTLFFQEASDEGYLVMSISTGFDMDDVTNRIEELCKRESLDMLLEGSKFGMIQNENDKFERDLHEIFEVSVISTAEGSEKPLNAENRDDYSPPVADMNIPTTKKSIDKHNEKEGSGMFEDDDELESVLEALDEM